MALKYTGMVVVLAHKDGLVLKDIAFGKPNPLVRVLPFRRTDFHAMIITVENH
jgi:hypothetical protein